MKKLIFSTAITVSPWKTGQSKGVYTTIRMNMTCLNAVWKENDETTTANVPTEIFAYIKSGNKYIFDHICSAMDLADMPTTEGSSWCRRNYIDILFPSFEIAEDSADHIREDIQFLCREIESYTNIKGQKTENISDDYYYTT